MKVLRLVPWIGTLLSAVAGWGPEARASPPAPDIRVKAAYIFHFIQYVRWPPRAFAESRSPFVIGVIGDGTIDPALTAIVRGEKAGDRPIEVRHLYRRSQAGACQIVYVSREGEDLFRSLHLRGAPILTVGETDSFLREGGIVAFRPEENHIRLQVNLAAAHFAALDVSAKLLRVAAVFPGN